MELIIIVVLPLANQSREPGNHPVWAKGTTSQISNVHTVFTASVNRPLGQPSGSPATK